MVVMATTPAVTAGIYVRISQDRAGKSLGVARQEAECRKLAKQLGWRVHRVYNDNDLSAFTGKRRPDFEALLADMEAGQINALICVDTDPAVPPHEGLERLVDIADANGVKIKAVQSGELDLGTSAGRMMARILGSVSRQESEQKSERLQLQRAQQARDGGWRGGGARPYGFEKDGVTIVPDEVAEIVRCTEAVVTRQSLRSLVRDLNERKVPTASHDNKKREKTGKGPASWTSVTLRDIIMRPRNAGLSVYKARWWARRRGLLWYRWRRGRRPARPLRREAAHEPQRRAGAVARHRVVRLRGLPRTHTQGRGWW